MKGEYKQAIILTHPL